MSDIVFIGLGRVGSLALELFLKDLNGDRYSITCVDAVDRSGLAEKLGARFVKASSPSEIARVASGAFLACIALPSIVAFRVAKEVISREANVVDVSFIREDPYLLDLDAVKNNVFYVPDAGFAPGYSNLVAGFFQDKLGGELDELIIHVGGIPVEPVPPIGYVITWNPLDLIEEYTRPARIVLNGTIQYVDPLSMIHRVEIEGLGVFEGFYSDGLRTMLRNIKAKKMVEITIRHPGHLQAMKLLKTLGFFQDKPVEVDGVRVEPRKLTAKLFEEKLSIKTKDIAILEVIARKKEQTLRHLSYLIGGNGKPPATTLYTALVYAKTIDIALRNNIEPGVQPLEKLHKYREEYDQYLSKYMKIEYK